MKLLYVTAGSAYDAHLWSGSVLHLRQALQGAGCDIKVFDEIPFECPLHLRLFHFCHKRFRTAVHYLQIEPEILQRAARRIEERFSRGDCDAIFCPGIGVPVATYVRAEIPTFSFLDASKASWIRMYFGLESLCNRSRCHVTLTDRAGLSSNRLTFVSSEWARDEIASEYPAAASKVVVVPFGANLDQPPPREKVFASIAARGREQLRLLFLGKEWERKGGPEAVAVVHALRSRGVNAILEIVGCEPDLSSVDRSVVSMHGFLDMNKARDKDRFQHLLEQMHILLFLSRAEAFGIAIAEAAAFGVPTLGTRTGGIPTAVRESHSGWLVDSGATQEVILLLEQIWNDRTTYLEFARRARGDFEDRLNWPAIGERLHEEIARAVGTGA